MVGSEGIEPSTLSTSKRCSTTELTAPNYIFCCKSISASGLFKLLGFIKFKKTLTKKLFKNATRKPKIITTNKNSIHIVAEAFETENPSFKASHTSNCGQIKSPETNPLTKKPIMLKAIDIFKRQTSKPKAQALKNPKSKITAPIAAITAVAITPIQSKNINTPDPYVFIKNIISPNAEVQTKNAAKAEDRNCLK